MITSPDLPVPLPPTGFEVHKTSAGKAYSHSQAQTRPAGVPSDEGTRTAGTQDSQESNEIRSDSTQASSTAKSLAVSRQARMAAHSAVPDATAAKRLTKLAKQVLVQQPATALSAHSQQLPQRALPLLS